MALPRPCRTDHVMPFRLPMSAARRLAPSLRLDPNAEHYPLSVKPEKKLTVKDMFDAFRDTYEDTPYDMTRTLLKIDRDGKATKSPIAIHIQIEL